jgi:hypothetical protein
MKGSTMSDDAAPSRREFYQALAALAAAPVASQSAAAQNQANPISAVAENLAGIAKAKYGQHLTEEQMERLKQAVLRDLYGAESLKKVPLQNGDEPSFIFRADLP